MTREIEPIWLLVSTMLNDMCKELLRSRTDEHIHGSLLYFSSMNYRGPEVSLSREALLLSIPL